MIEQYESGLGLMEQKHNSRNKMNIHLVELYERDDIESVLTYKNIDFIEFNLIYNARIISFSS